MRVLLINNGFPEPEPLSRDFRAHIPRVARDFLKPYVALMPNGVQQKVLGGFGYNEKRFPIGLGYLSAMLRKAGHEVDLVDRFARPGDWLPSKNFDFVGIYASTPFFHDVLRVLDRLQAEGFQGKVAVGGPHASIAPQTIPPWVHHVVQGEGEYVIVDLVEGHHPEGAILKTARIDNLDDLPRADFNLFMSRRDGYQLTFDFSRASPVFNLSTSRSCPYTCSFCGVRDIWGRLYRAQSAERVVDDVLFLKRDHGCQGVYFREDLFTADHKRVRGICELFLRENANIEWACETRVDAGSDEELVRLMAESGCRGFYIGAEAGSQRMLDIYNKEIQVEQIYRTCELAKKYGIAIYMSLIVGHPEETWEDKLAIVRLLKTTRPQMSGLAPYRAEFARHGSVDYPTYPERQQITISQKNGTWAGQGDRLRYLPVMAKAAP